MIPIKFRVFDDEHQSGMCDVLTIDFSNQEFGYVCNCGGVHWIYKKDFSLLMQFIGIRDKNNKEIYQGDIILNEIHDKPYTIEFGDHNTSDSPDSNNAYGFYFHRYDDDQSINYWTTKELNIIGNIYETPELLK